MCFSLFGRKKRTKSQTEQFLEAQKHQQELFLAALKEQTKSRLTNETKISEGLNKEVEQLKGFRQELVDFSKDISLSLKALRNELLTAVRISLKTNENDAVKSFQMNSEPLNLLKESLKEICEREKYIQVLQENSNRNLQSHVQDALSGEVDELKRFRQEMFELVRDFQKVVVKPHFIGNLEARHQAAPPEGPPEESIKDKGQLENSPKHGIQAFGESLITPIKSVNMIKSQYIPASAQENAGNDKMVPGEPVEVMQFQTNKPKFELSEKKIDFSPTSKPIPIPTQISYISAAEPLKEGAFEIDQDEVDMFGNSEEMGQEFPSDNMRSMEAHRTGLQGRGPQEWIEDIKEETGEDEDELLHFEEYDDSQYPKIDDKNLKQGDTPNLEKSITRNKNNFLSDSIKIKEKKQWWKNPNN